MPAGRAPDEPARAARIGRGADQRDDLVDAGDRDQRPTRMCARSRALLSRWWCAG